MQIYFKLLKWFDTVDPLLALETSHFKHAVGVCISDKPIGGVQIRDFNDFHPAKLFDN